MTPLGHGIVPHTSNDYVRLTITHKRRTFSVIGGYIHPSAKIDCSHLKTNDDTNERNPRQTSPPVAELNDTFFGISIRLTGSGGGRSVDLATQQPVSKIWRVALITIASPSSDERLDVPFTMHELDAAISVSRRSSAPGPEGITYAALRHFGQKFANLEDKILLTQIMRRYTVTSKLRMDQLQLSLEVVLKAIQGLEIKIRPRNRTMKGD
ncbi:hypothetical protein HPB52_021525 [Rhipicephalus sanguineus]|uniref:Uncharacterized protein n=1 Tax=Rhipicephalus sanguineus TaxID=34632 RepID=A0A9D4YQW9_RHISA|nr:hypothetical protein HPB52_021525 [Rhipicephalus sanguineus]